MKSKALVWFTGVITKYVFTPVYKINDLQINRELLRQLENDYNLIFIICVKDEQERDDYATFLRDEGLSIHQVLFLPYDFDFMSMMEQVMQSEPTITAYIDYSRSRLAKAGNFIKNDKLIHISQFLN